MPLVQERQFRVRHYECDGFGHVNHANYLRYMQEAAMDASAAAGYDLSRYEAIQRQWWIRETDITYLRPLVYGDSVIVKTWVADFHRVRSRRMYELRHATTGEIVAEAHTDWVYLNMATNRPTTIPPEMMAAFFPEGAPSEPAPREPFPETPPPPDGAFKTRRHVEWRDIDLAQHANNATYMAYFEDCAILDAAAHGWPISRMIEARQGIIARHYRIEYKQPALLGDELEVATWISDVKRSTAVRHFTVSRRQDGALLAQAHTLWVWVDFDSGHAARFPIEFVTAFAHDIAE